MDDYIYLDCNATTPIDQEVIDVITHSLKSDWGNASSCHHYGHSAKMVIQKAREQVSAMINSLPSEIIFMSGGTEANHTLLHSFSILTKIVNECVGSTSSIDTIPHIITSNIEHDSIRLPLEYMMHHKLASVTFVPVDHRTHSIKSCDIIKAIQPSTVLVSLMLANNETGVIQPIEEIATNLKRFCVENNRKIYLHTDAAQAIGKILVDVDKLNVDYMTIVGHKFYGPRIGALYVRNLGSQNASPYQPVFLGGRQERNLRSGTENTAMIAGLGKACELVSLNVGTYERYMEEHRCYLEETLKQRFGDKVNFNAKNKLSARLPNTCSVSFVGKQFVGQKVLAKCQYIIAGVGAACHSGNGHIEGSAILRASGISNSNARNAIRLSIGRSTTKDDIDKAIDDIENALLSLETEDN